MTGPMNQPGIICVVAKAPRPGAVKTRLARAVGPERAAALARAFFEDTWRWAATLPGVRRVLGTTTTALEDFGLDSAEVWLQGDGDLGARMERLARRALQEAPWVLLVGTDSPGLPPELLASARESLTHHEAVVGPAADGGFYLLGLRRLDEGLLSDLPWSSAQTLQATLARLAERGFSVGALPLHDDVDELADLQGLSARLRAAPSLAPTTAALLASTGVPR